MTRTTRSVWTLTVLAVLSSTAWADVKLPRVFGSHMVLQRDRELPVWGTASAGEDIAVTLGDKPAVTTKAADDGQWRVKLPAQPAGGPLKLTVKGKNEVAFDDVMIGEVWVCSGQSNMQWTVGISANAPKELAEADFPAIRQLEAPRIPAPYPSADLPGGEWRVCSPGTVANFTACGYFMAKVLHKELNVPIGIINSSWGGTLIEPWIAPVGFGQVPELKAQYDRVVGTDPKSDAYKARLTAYLKAVEDWMAKARESLAGSSRLAPIPAYPDELRPMTDFPQPQQQLSTLYNNMVHPLIPYAIRGAIWYQGESNHGETVTYTKKMAALIGGWRQLWGQGDFPFYYVQIAPFHYGNEPGEILANFWDAQAAALSIPNTGMVVTNDIAEYNDIHPKNKQEVGRRLALLALKGTYGRPATVADGPTFKELKVEDGRLRVVFDNVGSGLAARDGKPLNWFKIVGEDTDFEDAEATIDGNSVVLTSPKVPKPVAVQFGWHKSAEMNLSNKEGLPARPFRAGTVPKRDWLALKVPEAKEYTLALDLDLAKLGRDITYDADNRAQITKEISRIAYFLELQPQGKQMQWVYVAMDAFTKDLAKIGIPTFASKAVFQQKVANVTVLSNVEGIATGSGLQECNIEFWPHNYGPGNALKIPNASEQVWDFGDQRMQEGDYGCMQVHNYGAKQTIFAINRWIGGAGADLGMGNSSSNPQTRDWTFAGNAASYANKRLRVLVK